jgi:hypothetical protein
MKHVAVRATGRASRPELLFAGRHLGPPQSVRRRDRNTDARASAARYQRPVARKPMAQGCLISLVLAAFWVSVEFRKRVLGK